MTIKRILWAENDEQFEMAMMDMLGDPERVHEKMRILNVNRFPSSGNGGRGARERRETRRTVQRVTDILNQPPPMPLPPADNATTATTYDGFGTSRAATRKCTSAFTANAWDRRKAARWFTTDPTRNAASFIA